MKVFLHLMLYVVVLVLTTVVTALLLFPEGLIPEKCRFEVPQRLRLALSLGAEPNVPAAHELFRRAACLGNEEVVSLLLEHGLKPQDIHRDAEEPTLLAEVINKCGELSIIRLLVENGAPLPPLVGVNAPEWHELSPEVTDYLLTCGLQPELEEYLSFMLIPQLMERYAGRERELAAFAQQEKVHPSVRNSLFVAAVSGNNLPLVKALLQDGVPVSLLEEHACSLIHAGCGEHKSDISELVQVLKEAVFSLNKEYGKGKTLPEFAFECLHKDVYRVLVAAGADDAALRRKVGDLVYLSVFGTVEEVLAALPSAAPEQQEKALELAVSGERADLVTALLDAGVSSVGISLASVAFDEALLRRLLAREAEKTQKWRESVASALCQADAALYPLLLEAYGDVNTPLSEDGERGELLKLAIWNENTPLVRFLLQQGAEMSDRAVFAFSTEENLDALLEAGLDINRRAADGDTLLIRAARSGNAKETDMLLKNGANVNVRDEYGDTPLHSVVWSGDVDTVRLLLKAGADTEARNDEGKTPAEVAEEYAHGRILRVLLNQK